MFDKIVRREHEASYVSFKVSTPFSTILRDTNFQNIAGTFFINVSRKLFVTHSFHALFSQKRVYVDMKTRSKNVYKKF